MRTWAASRIGTWSGVRPLLAQEGKAPSEISRRDEIVTGEHTGVLAEVGDERHLLEGEVAEHFAVAHRREGVAIALDRMRGHDLRSDRAAFVHVDERLLHGNLQREDGSWSRFMTARYRRTR